MKKNIYIGCTVIGCLVLATGALLYFTNIYTMLPIPRPDLFPWATGFLGIIFVYIGANELCHRKTKEEEIDEKDERNIAISNTAKALSFNVLSALIGIALLAFAMLGYLTKIVFFTFATIILISQIVYIVKLWYLEKSM